jgi:Spy/CpxP family protein refolding chaperone
MKKLMMMIIAVAMAAVGYAQHGHGRPHRQGQRGPDMKETLGLDSAQYASIKGINQKYHERAVTLRRDTTRTIDARRTEFKSLHDARQKEINTVLTPEQRKKLETVKNERAERRKEAQKAFRDKRDNRIKSNLSISDKQLEEMKKARKESFEQAKNDYDWKMKSLLNEEQFKKWKEMDENKRRNR